MKIYIGADHRGFELKNNLKRWLDKNGHETEDMGAYELVANDDYVDFASMVAEAVSKESESRGIIICGSGVGVDITANKFKRVRCGLGFDTEQIKKAREDDDINILAIASDFTNEMVAEDLIAEFLQAEFNPTENHSRRIEKIKQLESGSK